MKNYLCSLIMVFAIPLLLFGQKNQRIAQGLQSLENVPRMIMPALDNATLLTAELDRRGPGIAPKFAENMEVDISPTTHGLWETTADGMEVWRMRIYSQGAKSINLGFSKYVMPEGGSLILYTPKRSEVLGPFTPFDNEEHEELWTPIVNGDELIIEVQIPASEKSNLQLQLKSVNHDFLGFAATSASMISGSCNLDVICTEVDGWGIVDGYRDIIRSVAVIGLNGGTFCTGFLVNNANSDCTPFFMTADHCGINPGNAASFVAYWNYESPVCRQPGSGASGGNGNGSLADFNTGAIHRASHSPSDMTLIELDDPVSETANAYFAGWSREFIMPSDTIIAIHHPNTDEKRITFEFDPAEPSNNSGGVTTINSASHIRIPGWDIGTTEPGSSGCPLFNKEKQVVGQLHGGAASCPNANDNDPTNDWDYFGWFNTSWEGGGTPATSLKSWLDPNDTGITSIGGKDCGFSIELDPPTQELCAPEDAVYNITIAENFELDVTLSTPSPPAGATVTFSPNPAPPNSTVTMTITNTGAVASGLYQIEVLGTDGINDANGMVSLTLFAAAPGSLNLATPPNNEIGVSISPLLNWDASSSGATYSLEIATDDAFTNIVADATGLTSPSYTGTVLNVLTTYYWRVSASNLCGNSPWSDIWNFTTANINCWSPTSVDVPINISNNGTPTVTSTLSISSTGLLTDIKVIDLDISHSFVGDLQAILESPFGTVIQLFDRPGVPDSGFGCDNPDLFVSFDDNASNSATDFENTCDADPAIGGTYQPINALSAFLGEDPNGNWTLTVTDNADDDGGVINGWALDICTTIPPDLGLTSSDEYLYHCQGGGNITFTLTIGNDFEATGVTLSEAGLPGGTTVTYSSNPALPGEEVTVTIIGANTTGDYPMIFTATDGINSTDASVVTLSIEAIPLAANLVYPIDAEINISLQPTLEWEASDFVDYYDIEVATDNAFNNVIAFTNTSTLTYPLTSTLEYGTTYFWRVNASGDCGTTISEINSFMTIPDLAVDISPEEQSVCNLDVANFAIAVGDGFLSPSNISFTIEPNIGVNVNYDVDPNDVMPGTTVTATISGLPIATAGDYTVTFTIADANNSVDITGILTIEGAPNISSLNTPADGAIDQSLLPSFSWTSVADADSYQIEIATDESFTNIIEVQTITTTGYTMTTPLDYETLYYWRVSAENECGSSPTAPDSFTTEMDVAVDELEGNAFQITPNPTSRHIEIVFTQKMTKDLVLAVYSIDGKLLQQHSYKNNIKRLPIDLNYTSGVYVVRMITAKAAVARRVVVE